jgi:hypothetical protein
MIVLILVITLMGGNGILPPKCHFDRAGEAERKGRKRNPERR